jgi:hypothetical protein
MKLINIVFLLLLPLFVFGQFSLKIGAIHSKVSFSKYEKELGYKSKTTPFFCGLYYKLNNSEKLSLETGLQYEGHTFGHSLLSKKQINHYLAIPINFNFKPLARVSPGIGIQASYL